MARFAQGCLHEGPPEPGSKSCSHAMALETGDLAYWSFRDGSCVWNFSGILLRNVWCVVFLSPCGLFKSCFHMQLCPIVVSSLSIQYDSMRLFSFSHAGIHVLHIYITHHLPTKLKKHIVTSNYNWYIYIYKKLHAMYCIYIYR